MEIRSKVAADAASVVPFHCVICFEEFNLTDRTPMVLPCGHTYVCNQCTKRLKRCMECREPLFLPLHAHGMKQNGNGGAGMRQAGAPAYNRGRYSPQPHMTPPQMQGGIPPSPPTPFPLPIPKNVVLIALMEAAQRQKKNESPKDEDEDDDEEYNLDRVIGGMATLSGPCGTYVVREEKGLALVDTHPSKKVVDEEDENRAGNEEDSSVKTLHKGQKVQIVSFSDGVAKLARGAGYILANQSQLVKVGQPLETLCRLEGLLETIERRGRDLQSTLEENNQIETSIRKQIEDNSHHQPNYPIITQLPRYSEDLLRSESKDEGLQHPRTPPTDRTNEGCRSSSNRTPHKTPPSTETELGSIENRLAFFGTTNLYPSSPNSIDNSELPASNLPTYRNARDDDELDHLAVGCGAAFLGSAATATLFGSNVIPRRNEISNGREYHSDRSLQPSRSRGNESPSPDHNFLIPDAPTLTSSFDAVDFRTGLSGHRGLQTTKPGHMSPTPRGQVRWMMSAHRGIATHGPPPQRRSHAATPALGPRFSPLPHNGGLYEHHV